MNKAEMIESIATTHDLSKRAATEIVDDVLDSIVDAVRKGEEVRLTGFGTFMAHHREAGEGRNPRTGETIKLPAKTVPKFKPHRAFREVVNGG